MCLLSAPANTAAVMYSTKEDALSPDELRKRLYQTFKNKGVLDTLKVRSASNTNAAPCCTPLTLLIAAARFRPNWGINSSRSSNSHLYQEENQSPSQCLWDLNLSWSQPVTAWWLITWAPRGMSTASLSSTLKVAYAKKRWDFCICLTHCGLKCKEYCCR